MSTTWLKERSVCHAGLRWFMRQKETDGVRVIQKLKAEGRYVMAYWVLTQILPEPRRTRFQASVKEILDRLFPQMGIMDSLPRNPDITNAILDEGLRLAQEEAQQ